MLTDRWSLVTFVTGTSAEEHVGILWADGTVCALPELAGYRTLMEVMEDWPQASSILTMADLDLREPIEDARVLSPLRYPRKILCTGANYWSHVREMGGALDLGAPDPYFFLVPATTIVGPHDAIRLPEAEEAMVDWEGELAVVIGRRAHNVSADSAPAYVAGYAICNDITARGIHRRNTYAAAPFEWDWLGSKGRDTFLPLGPGITPSWLVEDPHDLRLRVWVNGLLKQDARTSDLIVDIWQLVAAASAVLTLEPGDVVTTGTPSGVGAASGEFLHPGDIVTVEIEGLGRLSNPCRAEEVPALVVSPPPVAESTAEARSPEVGRVPATGA